MYQSLPQSRMCAPNLQHLQDDRLQEFNKKNDEKEKMQEKFVDTEV